MYLKIQALVLRITDYNDRDALLHVLTANYGRLTIKARGLRRKNSPLTAACQLLSYSEFTLFENKGYYTINEASPLEFFQGLRRDLQKLTLGTYFAQAAEITSQEDLPNPELLSLVLNCLYALSKTETPELQVKAAFEMRAACLAGYTPDLSGCRQCGCPDAELFDISSGCLECPSCRDPSSDGIRMPISPGVLEAMRYLCLCEPKRFLAFSLPLSALEHLSQITEAYLSTQLERSFSALDFYKKLIYDDASYV